MRLDPLKCTFCGHYISALRRCCDLKFLHALQIDQGYLAHTPTGMGVPPPQIFLSRKLKIGPKIQRMRLINCGAGGSIFTKLFQTTCREAGAIICVQFLEGRRPLKFGRAKKRANFGAISDNFRLLSRIHPEGIYIEHLKKT